MTTTPNNPFASWTAERLILCNYLRETPHTYTVLTRFAGHKNLSLRVEANRLRQKGQPGGARLTKDNQVVPDHPKNLALELFPLPDPPADLPAPHSNIRAANAKVVADLVQARLPGTLPAAGARHRLSVDQLVGLVDDYIASGAGGREFLAAIRTRVDMEGLAKHPGPPPPLTDADMVAELLALLKELPPHVCTQAWSHYCLDRTPPPPDSDLPPQEDNPDLDAR
jgi:hypothetical protein